jgi:hypothetical protein
MLFFRPRKLELNKRGNNINAQSISGNTTRFPKNFAVASSY